MTRICTAHRRHRVATVTAAALCPLLLLAACGGGNGGDGGNGETGGEQVAEENGSDHVTVRGETHYAPEHVASIGMIKFGEAVHAYESSIEFAWFYSSSLVSQGETGSSLADGVVDISNNPMAFSPADFPGDAWANGFGYGTDPRPVVGLLAAAAAMIEFGYSESAFEEEQAAMGLYALIPRYQNWDNYHLLCNEPVTTLEEAEGMRVRVGTEIYGALATSMGMTPVNLPGAEIYEAFDRGILDCFLGGEADMTGIGLWELGQHYTEVMAPGWNSLAVNMGLDFFEGLSADQQAAFHQNLGSFIEGFYTAYLDDQWRFFAEGPDMGVQFHQPSADLTGAIDDFYAQMRDDMVAEGPPGITDPQAAVERYEELQDKWLQIVLDLGYDSGHDTKEAWAAANPDGPPDVDLGPWAQRVQEEVFDVYRPVE